MKFSIGGVATEARAGQLAVRAADRKGAQQWEDVG